MFAPKVTEAQTRAATRKLSPQRAMPAVRPFDGGAGTERMPQRAKAPGPTWDFGKIPLFPPDRAGRGLRDKPAADEVLRGSTIGETIGDIARPVGAAIGNVVGGVAGVLTGISVSSADKTAPNWLPGGAFQWHVAFSTTGRSGWIVQEISNSFRAQNAAGASVAGPFTPHYWEAWPVDAAGTVTPSVGGTNDMWDQPDFNATLGAVEGHWATTAGLHFTTSNPATMGFTTNNLATNAGILLSTTTEPKGLGIARLHRYAQGGWDSKGAKPVHTGSAGP
jgi:hypothetical protein